MTTYNPTSVLSSNPFTFTYSTSIAPINSHTYQLKNSSGTIVYSSLNINYSFVGSSSGLNLPTGITYNGTNFFVSNYGNKTIYKVSSDGLNVSLYITLPNNIIGIYWNGTSFYVCSEAGTIYRVTNSSSPSYSIFCTGISQCYTITSDGTYFYAGGISQPIIYKIDPSSGSEPYTPSAYINLPSGNNIFYILYNGINLYAATILSNIYKITINVSPTYSPFTTGINYRSLVTDGNNFFGSTDNNNVNKINLSGTTTTAFSSGFSTPYQLFYLDGYLYVPNESANTISKVPTNYVFNNVTLTTLGINNIQLYDLTTSTVIDSSIQISVSSTCVGSDTKILMKDKTYKLVKDLQRGDIIIQDIKTNKIGIVTKLIKTKSNKIIIIPSGLINNNKELYVTENHPIWINNDINRVLPKNIKGVIILNKEIDVYNFYMDEEGSCYANNIKIDTLSPYHRKFPLQQKDFLIQNKYIKNIIINNEDDLIRNKPKLVNYYVPLLLDNNNE